MQELLQSGRAKSSDDFFHAVATWQGRKGQANGRLRAPSGLPDRLGEELRKLSTAIDRGLEEIEEEEQRVELIAASERCEALAPFKEIVQPLAPPKG